MSGKVYVAFTDWWCDNRQDFLGVFSSGLKAKEIFGDRKWKRVVDDDGSWCWLSEDNDCDYLVYKVNINQMTRSIE